MDSSRSGSLSLVVQRLEVKKAILELRVAPGVVTLGNVCRVQRAGGIPPRPLKGWRSPPRQPGLLGVLSLSRVWSQSEIRNELSKLGFRDSGLELVSVVGQEPIRPRPLLNLAGCLRQIRFP